MKKLVLLWMMFFCCVSFGFDYPDVTIDFNRTPPATVFYGETLRIPVQMGFKNLRTHKVWSMPEGSALELVSGYCPFVPYDARTLWFGTCNMNIVIPGNKLGKVVVGILSYHVWGDERGHDWNRVYSSPGFYVEVIPHPLSVLPIPIQEATANQPFVYNLKSAVKFYDENKMAGRPAQGLVNPVEQDGLRFDQNSFSIVGTPNRTGAYVFKVGAQNASSTASPTDFKVQVGVNLKDKPVFKKHYSLAGALPEQKYSMNLMELIEPQKGFMATNQISFRLDPNFNNPGWLHIAKEDATFLVGTVPSEAAGKEVVIRLIASSNTGGDSEPWAVKIPIAYDPAKKPVIEAFELEKLAGSNIYEDLSGYVKDPARASDLKVILDKVEPAASWLHISSLNPTVLEGTVPDEATGQKYQLTLRANTSIGGSSNSIVIPLQISVDEEQTPRFKAANPLIPMLYPGQPFSYDFVANKDIYPEYNDAPYEIKFASGFNPPNWLRIEENKLISDLIPDDIDYVVNIKVVIKNIPGGLSGENLLSLRVMN
ncbi:hypothetical protein [Legionella maioricensis]|uniref:Ig-like domain-containing protein n=1 Tax=Legionella maioricensis TaxID=2896528 RepID=A0A9X2D3M6_9GAMM|nr:hypothetical protein [Legionella maioricensis]MCL9685784.1 hypothetical protein [Legionella maioricensis]MCL9689201.1 hypothetical protein [Legionella maioricensis]